VHDAEDETYLRDQRGLSEATIYHCVRFLERFMTFRFGATLGNLDNITPGGQETFNGACTVVPEGPRAGLIMGEVEFARRAGSGIEPKFRIFATDQLP
jgi:hypothetical protein